MKKNLMIAFFLFAMMGIAHAEDKKPTSKDNAGLSSVNFSEFDISDTLNYFRGKRVTLLLDNGEKMTGKLQDTGYSSAKMVRITALENMDYFDAVIAKHSIIGVIFRTQ